MVYLAKKNGMVVHHTSLQAMFEMDGINKADMQVSDEEFEAADCIANIVDGKIFLGKTTDEKAAEANRIRIAEIDAELDEIDQRSGRPARAVASAIAKGETPQQADISTLDGLEKEASELRKERRNLATFGVAG